MKRLVTVLNHLETADSSDQQNRKQQQSKIQQSILCPQQEQQQLSSLVNQSLDQSASALPKSSQIMLNSTRSLTEWGHDIFSMLLKDVQITERHGGDLVAETLKAHGVKFIFCLSGGHISPLLVSSENLGIRIVDVRHEVNAVFAADAVGRLTGIPGVAAVTAGPGVTNTVTALKNCAMAQSPMILLGGAAATVMQDRGALQDIDQMAVISPVVKWAYSCRTVRDIVPALRTAFQKACSGVPGPVFIELPLDVLYPVTELLPQGGTHKRLRASDFQGKDIPKETLDKVVFPVEARLKGMNVQQFIDSKPPNSPIFVELDAEDKASLPMRLAFSLLIKRLHAGAHIPTCYDPLPVDIPLPKAAHVKKTAALLKAAERPLIIIGSQATLLGLEGTKKLAAALQKLQIPCFLGGMARGMLGRNHPLHIRQNRGGALKKCDLLIMLGVVPDFRLDYGRGLPSKVPIISVNRNAAELKQNTDLFWRPTLAAESDPCTFLLQLADCVSTSEKWGLWAKQLKDDEIKKERANSSKAKERAVGRGSKEGESLINPLYLCEKLEEILPEDSILVADGGDFVATASYIVRPRGPLRWLDPGAFGTLGVGGGFALGAKLVNPNSQVWIIWGDGSCGYSLLEFDTFTRHKLPVIALVGNDACWSQIEREQVPMFNADTACALEYINYHVAAEGLGAKGLELKSPNEDVKAVLVQAQKMASNGKPVLINALIGKTDFREGSLSV